MEKRYLITGVSGFIGYHVSKKLLDNNKNVIGIDNMNTYYDSELKSDRLKILMQHPNFEFIKIDLIDKNSIESLFINYKFQFVIHLGAQAGVRYSIDNPDVYINSNIIGTYNILEMCRYYPVEHLIYASSSSVYGGSNEVPFKETDFVDNPISLYAASKKSNELMAYTYSHLYDIPSTGMRFFTVYGPMGRPDMAYFKFTNNFFQGAPIKVYNNGNIQNDLSRDFTYIDDVVESIVKLLYKAPKKFPRHNIYNIGNSNPEKLMDFIKTLEFCLSNSLKKKIKFEIEYHPIQSGDVLKTYASTKSLEALIGFKPTVKLIDGLQKFTDWYVEYYKK